MAIPRIELESPDDLKFLIDQTLLSHEELEEFFTRENPGLLVIISHLINAGIRISGTHSIESVLFCALVKLVQVLNAYDDLVAKRLLEER